MKIIISMTKKLTSPAAILAVAVTLSVIGFGGSSARAQVQTDPGVARVSFSRGEVSMQRGDSGEESAVTLNTPLMAGDTLFTSPSARAEIQLDYANLLRLDDNSEANIATLNNNRIQVQIGDGLASYSILRGSQADVEIDTPNVSVHPLREGRYRIEILPNGDSEVTVREGEADVSTSQGSTRVTRGQIIIIQGSADDAQYRVDAADANDAFDSWNSDRDRIIFNAESARRTNRYYTGVGDLDAYGSWSDVPDYGPVWIPAVDVSWAPYRAGRWVWEPYWGWTWVSDESWGWAPYHYGRWFQYNDRWAWWPGPITPVYRPVWAPAYVSFFGFGGSGFSLNVGFGFGSIGWLPIGPCDYYHPWWGGYRERFAVVDIRNSYNNHDGFRPLHGGDRFSNLRQVEFNERVRGGISGVRADSFGRGRETPRRVNADEFRNGRMMTGNLPVVPGRDSLRVSDRPVNARNGNNGFNGRGNGPDTGQGNGQNSRNGRNDQQRFFVKHIPEGPRESFSDQSSRIQTAIQRDGNFRAINASPANTGGNSNNGRGDNGRFGNVPANNGPASTGGNRPNQIPQGRGQQDRGFQGRSDVPQQSNPPATPQGNPRADRNQSNQDNQPGGWNRFGRSGSNQGQPQVLRSPDQPQAIPQQGNNQPPVNERDRSGGRNNRFEMQGTPNQQPQVQPNQPSQPNPSDQGGNRGNQPNSGWQRFNGRNNTDNNSQPNVQQNSRPPLDMRQPIVNPRDERRGGGNGRQNDAPQNEPNFRSAPSAPAYVPPAAPAPRSEPDFRGRGGNRDVPAYSAPQPRSEPNFRNAPQAPAYVPPAAPAPRNEPDFRGRGGNRDVPAYSAPQPRNEPSFRGNQGGRGNRVEAPVQQAPQPRSEPAPQNNGGGGNRDGGGNRGRGNGNDGGGDRGRGRR